MYLTICMYTKSFCIWQSWWIWYPCKLLTVILHIYVTTLVGISTLSPVSTLANPQSLNSSIPQSTHWGRVTHICVCKLTIIGSDNGLSTGRRQTIIWTNAEILLSGLLVTNFGEISIKIHIFSFTKMHLNMSSGNWQPSCLGLNVLIEDHEIEWHSRAKFKVPHW